MNEIVYSLIFQKKNPKAYDFYIQKLEKCYSSMASNFFSHEWMNESDKKGAKLVERVLRGKFNLIIY